MDHSEVHNQIRRVLAEATDEVAVQLTGGDGWFQRALKDRVILLRKLMVHLDESVLVNHRHFAVTVVPEPVQRHTLITAEVARLRQEVRISERERLMAQNDLFIEDAVAELKDRFQQAVFEPPKPTEQTPPVQP